MSRTPTLLFLTLSLLAPPTHADWDAKLEAEEQAKREAAAREERARKAEADAMMAAARAKADAAMMAEKRKTLGSAAAGRSDAEVNRLYDAHVAKKTAEAKAAFAEGQKALSSGAGAAAMKQVTGHSMQELQAMSDEELEAFAKEMEAKYGGE